MQGAVDELIELSRDLGRDDRRLVILGEGNTSTLVAEGQFAVKASGASLANLQGVDLTICHQAALLGMLDQKQLTDSQVSDGLMASRVDGKARRPSIESVFHAWLLTLQGVRFVGHTHPLEVNQVLCSPRARDFSERRMFPDEVVVCGPASVFVPYTDPGLPLAREIRDRTRAFLDKQGILPRVILLQNHGLIAFGPSAAAVRAATFMAVKAAGIFMGAAALGGPVFLTPQHVERIAGRDDEAYRQQQLRI